MQKKKLVIFMPSIEGGGVEKNFFIIANYFSKSHDNLTVITSNSTASNKLRDNINLISPKYKFWNNYSRRLKYAICLILLIREVLRNKNLIVFAFQANLYCVIICKLLRVKV